MVRNNFYSEFSKQMRFFLSFLFLWSGNYLLASDDPPDVMYKDGSLTTDVLPYGKYFNIKGSAVTPLGDTADLIVVKIKSIPRDCDCCREKDYSYDEEYLWQQRGHLADFSIPVGTPLQLGEHYSVDIRFYKFQSVDYDFIKDIVYKTIATITSSGYSTNSFVHTQIESELKEKNTNDKPAKGEEYSDARINLLLQYRFVGKKDQLENAINDVCLFYLDSARHKVEFDRCSLLVAQTSSSDEPNYNAAKKKLEKAAADIALDAQYSIEKRGVLNLTIINAFNGKPVVLSWVKLEDYCATNTRTKSDELRVHTDYGGGFAILNGRNNLNEGRIFGYLAVRIYFCQLDKGMERPYKKHFARRFSGVLGWASPNRLSFRGEQMGSVQFLSFNVKPVLGFGFDICKYITFNFGTIIFIQQDPNPFTRREYTVFAPFCSLSWDLNLINKLKDMTNP